MNNNIHNPDVLSCLANLSSDEVFTPPEIANAMLDLLPQELFSDPSVTFLDPCCKSGVFLREIAKRLNKGLEAHLPNREERLEHIFRNQLFGIAITELTSLLARRGVYCSKYPNGPYSVVRFDNAEGNIRYKHITHTWKSGKCVFCGASQAAYGEQARQEGLESHAYEFIHANNPNNLFPMNFDVIIGNLPYQLDDGGNGASAKPLYHLFVEQSKKLNPRYISMIIPARWYSGGKGLDSFRFSMLNDERISKLIDYTSSEDCFPGVDIAGGICYFLWEREYSGPCNYTNNLNGKRDNLIKSLNEYKTFIRYPAADGIIKKITLLKETCMNTIVSTRKPFGLATNVVPSCSGELTLRYNKGTGKYPSDKVIIGRDLINKWKVMISYLSSEHAGQPDKSGMFRVLSTMEILPPTHICTETYLLAGWSDSQEEAENILKYLKTKFVRFLIAQIAVSQHITKNCFSFVPLQDFSKAWTDEELYAKYGLTEEEIEFIESMIRPMEG